MTLRDRFDEALANKRVKSCPTAQFLATLPAEDRAALEEALGNPDLSTLRIHAVLRAEGHSVGRNSIHAHRTGSCYCSDSSR